MLAEVKVSGQRVLILSAQTLFAESLVGLLEGHGYHVLGVEPFGEAALARIAAEQPSVVVLDARGAPPMAASALLEGRTDMRVVEVSLDSAVIAMYQRRQSAATAHGFLELMTAGDAELPDRGNAAEPIRADSTAGATSCAEQAGGDLSAQF